jgi:hypothetical protein
VNDITLLDSWVISAQGHFTKNTDLFPGKININLNGCPMKAVLYDGHSDFTTIYINHTYSDGSVMWYINGLEINLLGVVLQQMNMTLFYVPDPENFDIKRVGFPPILFGALFEKETFIALGNMGITNWLNSYYDCTSLYYFTSIRWYIPCSIKYPRWSSIFRILSVELWLVLITSIVIAAISTTLVGRYSCTSAWQRYKTLTSSLTNLWAVILGVAVSTMPRAPSLRSLFFAWLCFCLAFRTVFQSFLTSFLINSGYKAPIQNLDELFDSDIKLAYPQIYDFIFSNVDETESSKVQRNSVDCPLFEVCINWAMYQKNVSIFLSDLDAEERFALGDFFGEYSEPLVCKLEDGVFFQTGLTMVMFHGDPLLRRINEIIDRVVEAGLYNFWISQRMEWRKLISRKITIVHALDGYYSFNLYHMQPAFHLLFIGWCLSVLCFMFEVLYNRVLSKSKLIR